MIASVALIPISWVASTTIGNFLWINAIKNDAIHILSSIDANARHKKNRVSISKQLAEFIELHINSKKLSV